MNSGIPFDADGWRARYLAAYHRPGATTEDLLPLLEEWVAAHPEVRYFEATDPNDPPSFPPDVVAVMKFARHEKATPCALCGKRRKRHWTMLMPFRAAKFDAFVITPAERVFLPLTPVCEDHPLAPAALPPPDDELKPA